MDDRIRKIAALANNAHYEQAGGNAYINHAPHLKHRKLRELYGRLVVEIFDRAKAWTEVPRVLDLGAGEGTVTLPFLELGAKVVAVDLSKPQLDQLHEKCRAFHDRLEIRCEDIDTTLDRPDEQYDIVVANSFLHHIPDYLGMIARSIERLSPHGQFFSFQDPIRYDRVGFFTRQMGKVGYFTWRVFQGDVIGGLKRRWRRSRGVFLEDSIHDNAEYHVVRNGVDHEGIQSLFTERKINCQILPYWSDQTAFFQWLGAGLHMKNTFSVIARKGTTPEAAVETAGAINTPKPMVVDSTQ